MERNEGNMERPRERNDRFGRRNDRNRFGRDRFDRNERHGQRFERNDRNDSEGERTESVEGYDEDYKEYKGEEISDFETKKREIVIPGETIISGSDYLPGDFTFRDGNDVVASRFGLSEVSGRLVKVIPLAGVYMPRRGNVVIGKVIDVTFNGWIVAINAPYAGFLPVAEASRFVNKNDLTEYLDFGDMVVAKVDSIKRRGIDLTTRMKGLGNLADGMVISINPNKVPRVIGREGSMINLIKKETMSSIIVGQNGVIWLKGNDVESELLAKEAINFIVEKSFVEGLTDKVQQFFTDKKK